MYGYVTIDFNKPQSLNGASTERSHKKTSVPELLSVFAHVYFYCYVAMKKQTWKKKNTRHSSLPYLQFAWSADLEKKSEWSDKTIIKKGSIWITF